MRLESLLQRRGGATFLTRRARACATNAPIFAPPRVIGPICAFRSAGGDRRSAMHAGVVPWRAGHRLRPARPPSAFPGGRIDPVGSRNGSAHDSGDVGTGVARNQQFLALSRRRGQCRSAHSGIRCSVAAGSQTRSRERCGPRARSLRGHAFALAMRRPGRRRNLPIFCWALPGSAISFCASMILKTSEPHCFLLRSRKGQRNRAVRSPSHGDRPRENHCQKPCGFA